jgi:hypothetical protein
MVRGRESVGQLRRFSGVANPGPGGRPAVGGVESPRGGYIFACLELATSAKVHLSTGSWRSLAGHGTSAFVREPLHLAVEVID